MNNRKAFIDMLNSEIRSQNTPIEMIICMIQTSKSQKNDILARHEKWLEDKQQEVEIFHENTKELENEKKYYEEMLKNLKEKAR